MSRRRDEIINKIDRRKRLRYIKYADGYEVLIKYDTEFNKLESINSKGQLRLFQNDYIPTLSMDDLIKGRELNGRPIDNTKEECKYDHNGNIIYFSNGEGFWYKSIYDDNKNEIMYEDSNDKLVIRTFDSNNNLIEEIAASSKDVSKIFDLYISKLTNAINKLHLMTDNVADYLISKYVDEADIKKEIVSGRMSIEDVMNTKFTIEVTEYIGDINNNNEYDRALRKITVNHSNIEKEIKSLYIEEINEAVKIYCKANHENRNNISDLACSIEIALALINRDLIDYLIARGYCKQNSHIYKNLNIDEVYNFISHNENLDTDFMYMSILRNMVACAINWHITNDNINNIYSKRGVVQTMLHTLNFAACEIRSFTIVDKELRERFESGNDDVDTDMNNTSINYPFDYNPFDINK